MNLIDDKRKKRVALEKKLIKILLILIFLSLILTYILSLKLNIINEKPNPRVQSILNLKYIQAALSIYSSDNQGKLPDNLESLVPDYITSSYILICPRTSQKTKWSEIKGEPYEYLVAGRLWEELEDNDILVKEPSSVKNAYVIRKDGSYSETEKK
ncbi:MAG: hypothetical protein ACYSWZ_12215 [Planctomycetota bacterium]